MPVIKHSRSIGLNEDFFTPKVNEELMQIHRDYLDSPEKKAVDELIAHRMADAAVLGPMLVGYEIPSKNKCNLFKK